MYFKVFRPSAALEHYIRSYYYFCIDIEGAETVRTMRYPTDGSPKLVVNLGNAFLAGYDANNLKSFKGCRLIGPLSRQLVSKTEGRIAFIAIRFRPGKISSFFTVRDSELTDSSANLESLLGAYGKAFEQQLCHLGTIQEMLIHIERILLSQLQHHALIDTQISAALEMIQHMNGQIRVRDLAKRVGLSLRQFERRFTRQVGLYPKRLCRISRFANIISACGNGRSQSWVRMAIEGGYSDHAHFIRECKFFTGLSPNAYLDQRSPLEVAVWSNDHTIRAEKVGAFPSNHIKNPLL